VPKRLDTGDREKMKKETENKFSGVLLRMDILPYMPLLNAVQLQVSRKAWEFIPWKKLLSEGRVVEVRKQKQESAEKNFELLTVMARAAGVHEEESWESAPSGSHERVRDLLSTRAAAYAMTGACHWCSWTYYIDRFLQFYKKKSSSGHRGPSVEEAEEADREATQEVFDRCFQGSSLDDALYDVAITKDMLRGLLVQRAKPVLPPPPVLYFQPGKGAKGKGKKGKDGKVDLRPAGGKGPKRWGGDAEYGRESKRTKTGTCFAFQTGACTRSAKECKFIHVCDRCEKQHDPQEACP
jgi:hypothetical protein